MSESAADTWMAEEQLSDKDNYDDTHFNNFHLLFRVLDRLGCLVSFQTTILSFGNSVTDYLHRRPSGGEKIISQVALVILVSRFKR